MDFYSSNKIFKRMITKKGKVVFVLSEETIETLKRWELNEDTADVLVKLRRMLHTAPAVERRKLTKAILELEKKRKEEKRSNAGPNVEKRNSYIIYGNHGSKQDITITPDYWWSRETNKWSRDYVRTFVFIPDYGVPNNDMLLMPDITGYQYNHIKMIEDMISEDGIQHGDFTSEHLEKYDNDLQQLLEQDETIIHGRTGPLPLRGNPDNVKFCVSIWQAEVDRKILDQMMKAINKKMNVSYNILFVPENV